MSAEGARTVIILQDNTDWTLTDTGVTDGLGNSVDFNNDVENADITGGEDPHTFTVDGWSGDATLNGVAGGDTFNIGVNSTVVGNVTINGGGFLGDTFNIAKFTGTGNFNGTSGDDVFNINTTIITLSNVATALLAARLMPAAMR